MNDERVEITPPDAVTRLLADLRSGRREAFDELFEIIYQQLRAVAHRVRCGQTPDTLSTTALVHEAYLKLSSSSALCCDDRRHFFAVAGRAMRQIILDRSREVLAAKRGGASIHVSLDGVNIAVEQRARELVQLDQALDRLEVLDTRLARVVELRFFAGLTVEDASAVLETSPRTVKRDWRKARAFLLQALTPDGSQSAHAARCGETAGN